MNIKEKLKKLTIIYLLLIMTSGCKLSGDKSKNQRDSLFLILLNSLRAPKDCSVLMGGAIQTCGKDLSLKGLVSTIAGTGFSGLTNGTGTAARFHSPVGITTDGTNLYVADGVNHRIRKIVISTGEVSTLAGSGTSGSADGTGTAATFDTPLGITTDGTNLYVACPNNNRIRKIVISTGVVSTLAGSATSGSADGTGTAATFNSPIGITTDGTNLYVADTSNHRIRKIVISTGVVSTLAGSGAGSADGTGTAARFTNPFGITTDGNNLYITDRDNHRIRKIEIKTGVVTTIAGSGNDSSLDGTGSAAGFSNPTGIITDGINLYISEVFPSNRIRKIVIATGVVTTLAGSGSSGFTNGTGTSATFTNPRKLTTDGKFLYVADELNHSVRKIE